MMSARARRLTGRAALIAIAVALIGVALVTPTGATPRTVEITMRHSKFLPARFVVRRGATIRFVVTNADPVDHEIIIGDEAVQRRHETGTEAEHGTVPGEVTVPAGTTAETTFTFSRPGILLVGCHAPGHYAYGMRGRVMVVY
jgi:uncharacterized cupredoxin-like copper-binding protein